MKDFVIKHLLQDINELTQIKEQALVASNISHQIQTIDQPLEQITFITTVHTGCAKKSAP